MDRIRLGNTVFLVGAAGHWKGWLKWCAHVYVSVLVTANRVRFWGRGHCLRWSDESLDETCWARLLMKCLLAFVNLLGTKSIVDLSFKNALIILGILFDESESGICSPTKHFSITVVWVGIGNNSVRTMLHDSVGEALHRRLLHIPFAGDIWLDARCNEVLVCDRVEAAVGPNTRETFINFRCLFVSGEGCLLIHRVHALKVLSLTDVRVIESVNGNSANLAAW